MHDNLLIVGLGGSMAHNSTSLAALRVALRGAAHFGATTRLLDIRQLDLPMYAPGYKMLPEQVAQMNELVAAADGLIWSSPLYHGTVSGSFKNALDWLNPLQQMDPPYLSNKVIGLISTAGGTQGLQALNTMEFAVRALRGWAMPLVLPISQAWKVFDAEGQIQDEDVEIKLLEMGQQVARAAQRFAVERRAEYAANG
jgi:FMN reductase